MEPTTFISFLHDTGLTDGQISELQHELGESLFGTGTSDGNPKATSFQPAQDSGCFTIESMLARVREKAEHYSQKTGIPSGAGMSFNTSAGEVRVALRIKQSRINASSRNWYSRNFTLNGKRISKKRLEALLKLKKAGKDHALTAK